MASGVTSRVSQRQDTRPSPHPQSSKRVARWPALDGIRALAVIGVMLYHAGVKWVPGGLLGVDAFFVLSGFLITSLLLREVRVDGRISIGGFWARRARRLLPALLLVLLAVSIWAALDRTLDLSSVRLDIAAALGYVANWRFAFSHQGYFSASAEPSPVLHLWSLGVEEQFYLLWPLLVAGCVGISLGVRRLLRRRARPQRSAAPGRWLVLTLAAAGTAASTSWLILGALRGTDASRLYYGTDTRALALLTGATLAAIVPLPRTPRVVRPSVRVTLFWTIVGLAALGAFVGIVASVSGEDQLLYRGGFLVIAVLIALVIAAVTRAPRCAVSRLLGLPPLAHIGRISYGLYLWHWPVILFATSARTGLSGAALLGARLGAALALAEVSYWLAERPILRGGFPGRRLAVTGLVAAVAVVGVSGPWLAVPRSAAAANGETIASKLDALAKGQDQRTQALTKARSPLSNPSSSSASSSSSAGAPATAGKQPTTSGTTSRSASVTTPQKLPGGVPAQEPNPVPTEPMNTLLVGDSEAFSAFMALFKQEDAWKVNLINASRIGCGIAPGVGAGEGDQAPVAYGECWDWAQRWAQTVAAQRPAVSLLILGRWETVDRKVGNKVMRIGQPAYDKLLRSEFEKAVKVLGSYGGKVALATAPCYQRPERPDGSRWPQDDCRRVQDFNRIVWSVAAAHPSNVVVLDLYQYFSPDGRWHLKIDGQQVRDPDGLHYNIYGGKYLAPVFLGGLRTLMGLPAVPQAPPKVTLTPKTGG